LDAAARAGLTFRNYGEFVTVISAKMWKLLAKTQEELSRRFKRRARHTQ